MGRGALSLNPETALSRNIRLAVNKTKRARLLDNEVGMDQTTHRRYGLGIGSPDLVGCLRCGRVFCLEIKTPKGKPPTVEQLAFMRAVRLWGGFACVARSIDDALAALDRAEQGLSE